MAVVAMRHNIKIYPTIQCKFLLILKMVGWLCWGLTSQSTIFQSCRDGAIASWVINHYFRGVKCLAQGHNTAEVGLEPRTSRSWVRHSTTEPPRSPILKMGIPVSVPTGCNVLKSAYPFSVLWFTDILAYLWKQTELLCFVLVGQEYKRP